MKGTPNDQVVALARGDVVAVVGQPALVDDRPPWHLGNGGLVVNDQFAPSERETQAHVDRQA
jgi:hypothetical protein